MGEPVLVVEDIVRRLAQVPATQQEFKLYVPPLIAMALFLWKLAAPAQALNDHGVVATKDHGSGRRSLCRSTGLAIKLRCR